MSNSPRTVFVLGAGFTKASYQDAPLLEDYFGINKLCEEYKHFPHIISILGNELSRADDKTLNDDGDKRINLERLLTRLDAKMPYDFERDHAADIDTVRGKLIDSLMHRIELSSDSADERLTDLHFLAAHCLNHQVQVITFNYDDFFERALVHASGGVAANPWSPDDGYGFYLRNVLRVFREYREYRNRSQVAVLKLHGSVNWFAKLGAGSPYMLDSLAHWSRWFTPGMLGTADMAEMPDEHEIARHLERRPVIVPPVLAKTALRDQPLLRVVWTRARDVLREAVHVVFVGYSLPSTDIAAATLFSEAIRHRDVRIEIVNFASGERGREDQSKIRSTYENALPQIPVGNFDFRFDGALAWAREFNPHRKSL